MEFTIKDFTFRIKKMNMIELLALRSVVSFDNVEKVMACYNSILERIEVNVKDKWLPVKSGNNYFPAGIETDAESIEECISQGLKYIQSVFQKSNALNNEQESMTLEA